MTDLATGQLPDGWEGLLDKDERIIWQGRPGGGFEFRIGNAVGAVFGLFFAGFALFWMIMASMAGGFFWMFGLLHFFVGLGIAFGSVFWGAWKRRHSWYTLTDRRAFIATDIPFKGRSLKSYPITAATTLDFVSDDPASIMFAREMRRGRNGSYEAQVGFERIADAPEVYRMMREIQELKQE